MSKKLQLTIPKPCHENWDVMTPVEKGKFCGSCQKQVVDFSNMSDRQVAEFFKKPSGGSVCGRFMTDQLDRDIEIPKKRIPWVKYFFQFAIPAFLISIKTSAQRTAKVRVNTVAQSNTQKPVRIEQNVTLGMVSRPLNLKEFIAEPVTKKPVEKIKGETKIASDTTAVPVKEPVCNREIMGKVAMPIQINKNEIEGRVVDEKGEPVSFASIETGAPGKAVIADENGFFKFKRAWLNNETELVVSSVGFERKTIKTGEQVYTAGKLYVTLKSNAVLLPVVVNSYGPVRHTSVVGEIAFIKGQTIIDTKDSIMTKEIKMPLDENRLTVYPNPVPSGTTISVSFKNHEEGYYQLLLSSQAGQTVQQKEIWIDAEAGVLNIDIPTVPGGAYFLVMTNKKSGKKFTGKIIIQ